MTVNAGRVIIPNLFKVNASQVSHLTELDPFLRSVEKRAYHMALAATGQREEALDIVQDSMTKLFQKYAQCSPDEWRFLFFRIVQNGIRDWYRRQKVRSIVQSLTGKDDETETSGFWEPFQADVNYSPEDQMIRNQTLKRLIEAIQQLPRRQRETFYLRSWEAMSTKETAHVLNISEGSVKTHYSRALHQLHRALEVQ